MLKEIDLQLKKLEKYIKNYDEDALLKDYDQISDDRKALITTRELSDEEYAENWLKEAYQSKGFAMNDLEIYTEKDERVRSKSEKILADKFYMKGIPYKYECPIILKGFGTIYPDFTVLNKRTRKIYYWEHLGMMDDPVYAERAIQKIETYERNGIYQGKQLILTYEMKNRPLNIKIAEKLMEEFLM